MRLATCQPSPGPPLPSCPPPAIPNSPFYRPPASSPSGPCWPLSPLSPSTLRALSEWGGGLPPSAASGTLDGPLHGSVRLGLPRPERAALCPRLQQWRPGRARTGLRQPLQGTAAVRGRAPSDGKTPPTSPPGPTSPLGSQGGEGCAGGAALPPAETSRSNRVKAGDPRSGQEGPQGPRQCSR